MKAFPLIFAILLLTKASFPQNDDSIDTARANFQDFEKSWNDGFKNYSAQHDSNLSKYLRNHWEKYQIFIDSIIPKIKPKKQPRFIPETGKVEFIDPDSAIGKDERKFYQIFQDSPPVKNDINYFSPETSFEFYGEKPVNNFKQTGIKVTSVNESSIKEFLRKYYSDKTLEKNKIELIRIARDLGLNDYGYYLLLRKAAVQMFDNQNERALFTWLYLRSMNKRKVILGYDKNNSYCLAACDKNLFNHQYVLIEKVKYYVFLAPGQPKPNGDLSYYDLENSTKTDPLTLEIASFPNLSYRMSTQFYPFNRDTLRINTNLFLIEFLRDFPQTSLKYYFDAPVSEKALNALDHEVKPLLNGKTEVEKVNTLLAFFHKSFRYKTDQEQFGSEKYMFCDEVLFYPYTDCDDRAVLFARLVQRYTGLSVIGLDYPNHVSVGVCFSTPAPGDSVKFRKKNYLICDPTIINAKVGNASDSMNAANPDIIEVNIDSMKNSN